MIKHDEVYDNIVKTSRKHALDGLKKQGLDIALMSDSEKAAFEMGLASGVLATLEVMVEVTS